MTNDAGSITSPEGVTDNGTPADGTLDPLGGYANQEELAKGKFEADKHIKTLEAELSEARGTINTSTNMDSFLEKLKEVNVGQVESRQAPTEATHEESVPTDLSAQVDALVSQKVNQIAAKSQRVQNFSAAKETLEKTYGPNYGAEVHKARVALGESDEFMNTLAADNPHAFIKLVTAMSPVQEASHISPNVAAPVSTAPSFDPVNSTRDEKYYSELRKKDHALYMSHEVQSQMQRDSQRMGEAFFTK